MKSIGQMLTLLFLFIILTESCKKEAPPKNAIQDPILIKDSTKNNSDLPNLPPGTEEEKEKDSIYVYAKEAYLWQNLLPSYEDFNPRRFSTEKELVDSIKAYQLLDKYTLLLTNEEAAPLIKGEVNDFGFMPGYMPSITEDLSYQFDFFVQYVYPGSPGGLAGIQRGWQLLSVNGEELNLQAISDISHVFWQAFVFGTVNQIDAEFVKPDGSHVSISVTKSGYTLQPVLFHDVFEVEGKRIGYLVYNQFVVGSGNALIKAVNEMTQEGAESVIVDLRYNQGGAVQVQDTLANLLAPVSANGSIMYKEVYNENLSSNKYPLLRKKFDLPGTNMFDPEKKTIRFKKIGNLNIDKVVFITSVATASSSEALINNLKPYLNVTLIGQNTYGKPVGYFGIPVKNHMFFPVSFKIINSKGDDNYYDGFPSDYGDDLPDAVNKNWGNMEDYLFIASLHYLVNNKFPGIRAIDPNGELLSARSKTTIISSQEKLTKKILQNQSSYKKAGMYKFSN